MTRVLALADDLTGALEVGARFAGEGIPSIVTSDATLQSSEPVLVIDTQTRHLDALGAALRVKQALSEANIPGLRLVFKKTDSTLRGNIAAELSAVSNFYGSDVTFVPAYPAMGRTVKNGRLYVNGLPLEQTSFAHDCLNPVSNSRIDGGERCHVVDGETDDDVRRAASLMLKGTAPVLAAGTGALAGALASEIDLPRQPLSALPVVRSCLVFNGSLHFASARQLAPLTAARWTVLPWSPVPGQTPLQIADDNGKLIRDALRLGSFDAVLICGGDTAYGMLKAVGFPPLRPVAEVVTGVPLSRIVVDGRELSLITKAGGFGSPDILLQVEKRLNG